MRALRRDGESLDRLPGLDADEMLSASSLGTLLGCPRRFLFESVLGWKKPSNARPMRELDAPTFGSLVHAAAEAFYREHGAAFGARDGSLPDWQPIAASVASATFEDEARSWPLSGDAVKEAQRQRLLAAIALLIEADWGDGTPRQFVDVERQFGYDEPLRIGGIALRGRIDRIDVQAKRTTLRDLKTGKPHPRRVGEPPEYDCDLQIGVYGLIAEQLAKSWGVPKKVAAAYLYIGYADTTERDFSDEYAALRESTLGWLDIAKRLLVEGRLPKTANSHVCGYCPFNVVCGPDPASDGAASMRAAGGACADLLALHAPMKGGD